MKLSIKSKKAKKPFVKGFQAKRKSTVVSDTIVSKLPCLSGQDDP